MPDKIHPLEELLHQRIVVLDGAMGTMIQRRKLSEQDYRGEKFRDWKGKDLKGSLELLNLTQPQVIEEIHSAYLEAGADIIETNTFSATTIGLHDFLFQGEPKDGRKDQEFFHRVVNDVDLRALVREMNLSAATIARHAADQATKQTGKRRFVGGSIGPLPVAASVSPDLNDPGFRAVTFGQLRQSYFDQISALVEGGVDLLLIETIFDTLNGKAALFAVADVFERTLKKLPLIVSGTVTDKAGRTLSGQTVEAFLVSIAHAQPLVVGLNCSLGPDEMNPFIEDIARVAPFYVSAYPNAGLPDPLSEIDFERRFRRRAGGCAAAGARRGQHARRQHGRRDDRFGSRDDAFLEFDRKRTRDRADSNHDRQLKVERDRGRAQMRARESGREFDQLEKRRRRIFASGATDQAIWRGCDRDGVR